MKDKVQKYIERTIYTAAIVCMAIIFFTYKSNLPFNIKYVSSVIGKVVPFCVTLSYLYNKYFWKCKWFFWEKTPKLLKKYEGYMYSSYDNYQNPIKCSIEVSQTLLKINVTMKTNESFSETIVSEIVKTSNIYELIYTYANEPTSLHMNHSDIHYGTAKIRIDDENHLTGKYWTNRKHQTKGDIILVEEGKRENIVYPLDDEGLVS